MEVTQGALVGKRLGNYELLALLAIGGTAEIYLARIGGEAGFEKYVVVKCLLDHLADEEDYVKMFLDEARLGAQLDHSNIVQTLELGEHEGRYFMAMEYLAGMSLAQLARKTNERVPGGKLPVELVLGLAAQTCAGLHYAHRKHTADGVHLNLVHRDISPQNLVISFDGVLKIVDFGIAKATVRDTHTQSGTIKGKFAYMSPEQCLAKEIDFRTDIFALGVILHELLTARRLFKRKTTYETYEAIVKGEVPTPSSVNPDLDSALDEVVMKALRYNKKDRYESAEALGQALLGVIHKRGRAVNASDIASYYEKHFEDELRDHHMRMRLLITGKRDNAVGEESINWDSAEAGEISEEEMEIDPDDSMIEEVAPEHLEEIESIDAGEPIADEGATMDVASDDEPKTVPEDEPEGATRIEENPLTFSRPASAKAKAAVAAALAAKAAPATSAPGTSAPATRAAPDRTKTAVNEPDAKPGAKPDWGPTIRDPAGAAPGAKPDFGPTIRDPAGAVAPTESQTGETLREPAEPVRSSRQTAGPSDKTIMPGQMMSPLAKIVPVPAKPEPPKVASEPAKGRGPRPGRKKPPTRDLGPKADKPMEPLLAAPTIQDLGSPVSGEFEIPSLDPKDAVISDQKETKPPPTRPPSSVPKVPVRAEPAAAAKADSTKPKRTMLGVSPFAQKSDDKSKLPPLSPPAGTPPRPRPGTSSSTRDLYSAPPRKDGPPPGAQTGQPSPGPGAQPGPPGPPGSPGKVPIPPDTIPPAGTDRQAALRPSGQHMHSSGSLPRLQPPATGPYPPPPAPVIAKSGPEMWMLGLAFAVSFGIGLGITLLVASF